MKIDLEIISSNSLEYSVNEKSNVYEVMSNVKNLIVNVISIKEKC